MEAKKTAEQIGEIIEVLSKKTEDISEAHTTVEKIKGASCIIQI